MLKATGGRQHTLGDCGIGVGARGTGPEAPGRCLEHNAIGRMSESELCAYWERTQQRSWRQPTGVAGAGSGGRRIGEDAEKGRLSVVRNILDEVPGSTDMGRGRASVPGHTVASPACLDQYDQGGDAESGGRKAARGRIQTGPDTAGATERGDADRCAQEADDEEIDGNMHCNGGQGRRTARGAEAQQGSVA